MVWWYDVIRSLVRKVKVPLLISSKEWELAIPISSKEGGGGHPSGSSEEAGDADPSSLLSKSGRSNPNLLKRMYRRPSRSRLRRVEHGHPLCPQK